MIKQLLNREIILKSLLISTLLSISIYLAHFNIEIKLLNSIFALVGLYFLIILDKRYNFWIGFFIGILWFYWVSFSFIYYKLPYLIPIVILVFALTYGIIFYIFGFIKNLFLKAVLLIYLFDFIEPFGFNWFKLEVLFIDSYFGIDKISLGLILISIATFIYLPKKFKLITLIPLFLGTNFINSHIFKKEILDKPNGQIYLSKTDIKQKDKWKKENLRSIVENNFRLINEAIDEKKELIILPESAFPLFLNLEPILLDKLKLLSKKITIWTGSLKYENEKFYNSTYLFQNGEFKIADKVVLVPFGEKIPLPDFMVSFISKIFFDGAKDYEVASKPTDFKIENNIFRSAICYEITSEIIYQNAPKYIIAISNNAWFLPSIEPTLQKLLIKFYSKKYNKIVFHSINASESYIIK